MDPHHGVFFGSWAALSLLMLLGVRFPVSRLPLMLLQLFTNLTWLIAVGHPSWAAGRLDRVASERVNACAFGAVLDLAVIPWPEVFENHAGRVFKLEAKHESPSPYRSPMAK